MPKGRRHKPGPRPGSKSNNPAGRPRSARARRVQLSVRLTRKEAAALKRWAKGQGMPVAKAVRKLVGEALTRVYHATFRDEK